MISPAIAGNDSRCSIALRVFLGEFSANKLQYPYPTADQVINGVSGNFDLNLPKADFRIPPT